MNYNFEIEPEKKLLKESFTGIITLQDLSKANSTVLAHPKFQQGMNILTDLRNGQISFGYQQMNQHILSLPNLHVAKQAFVVAGETEYGMIRMFMTLIENKSYFEEVELFRDMEEALRWLNS